MTATDEHWVYLDTNVLIDLSEAVDGVWVPPEPLVDPIDQRRLASTRIAFYAGRRGWELATSTEARKEGLRGLALDLLDPLIVEVDELNGGPTEADLQDLVTQYLAAGLKPSDAAHAAQCASRPQFWLFVTSDEKLLERAPKVGLGHSLDFVTPTKVVDLMGIQDGEEPSIRPSASNPLSQLTPWWIP